MQTHPCVHVCVPSVISYHLSLPSNGHMIAENSSQMLRQMFCPLSQKMHICDKSAALDSLLAPGTYSPTPQKITFLSWHWQIGLIDFVKSYCDHSALGEVPDFCAINHVTDDSDIHTCSTAGSLVAQFLVPFPANRQAKVSHCIVCLCVWASYSLQVRPSASEAGKVSEKWHSVKTWLHWSWKTWSHGLWSVFKMNKCSRTSGCWCNDFTRIWMW